jgi:opacity protein-like surface antigen
MKKFIILMLAAMLVLAAGTTVFAKSAKGAAPAGIEGDASLVFASAPASGFGTSVGLTIGAGMMLPSVENLQVRIDQSFFSWSQSEFGFDLKYTRYPMTASARYYFPVRPERLKVYGQGGIEVSFDKVEATTIVGYTGFFQPIYGKVSDSSTNIGITPGGGVAFQINDKLSVAADFRIHLITDSYFTLQGGIVYNF